MAMTSLKFRAALGVLCGLCLPLAMQAAWGAGNIHYVGSYPISIGVAYSGDTNGTVACLGWQNTSPPYNGGFQIIGLVNPYAPALLGSYSTTRGALDIVIVGPLAYIVTGDSAFEIVNISNPAMPVRLGIAGPPGQPTALAVSGNYAFIVGSRADAYRDLWVFDVSNPTRPQFVGSYERKNSSPHNICIVDQLAYVTGASNDLEIYDISDPAAPTRLGAVDLGGETFGVFVSGTLAYVGRGGAIEENRLMYRLQMVDVSSSSTPALFSQIEIPGSGNGVWVDQNVAYVGYATQGSGGGLQMIDVADPAVPALKDSALTNLGVGGVKVVGGLIYLFGQEFIILRYEERVPVQAKQWHLYR